MACGGYAWRARPQGFSKLLTRLFVFGILSLLVKTENSLINAPGISFFDGTRASPSAVHRARRTFAANMQNDKIAVDFQSAIHLPTFTTTERIPHV
jgi:hypothetical protein